MDEEPVKVITVEILTTVTGAKTVGTIAAIVKGINKKLITNLLDASAQMAEQVTNSTLKSSANSEGECD